MSNVEKLSFSNPLWESETKQWEKKKIFIIDTHT